MFATHVMETDKATLDAFEFDTRVKLECGMADSGELEFGEELMHTMSMAALITKATVGYGRFKGDKCGFYHKTTRGDITWYMRLTDESAVAGYLGARKRKGLVMFLEPLLLKPMVTVAKRFSAGSTVAS